MEVRGTIKAMDQFFDGSSLKHIMFNYSQSEVGFRHPDGPVGAMARDQGQLDLYSGRCRLIMSVDGYTLTMARSWGLMSDTIVFRTPSIQSMKFNGRVLGQNLYGGQNVFALRSEIPKTVGFVSQDLLINLQTGRIQSGFIPVSTYLDPQKVFEADLGTDILPTKDERKYVLWTKALEGK